MLEGSEKLHVSTPHVGPDVLVRAGELNSPPIRKDCRVALGRAGEGTCPYAWLASASSVGGSYAIVVPT
jgi:hypothetical protein